MSKPAFILDPTQHITISFDDGLMETIYASDPRFDDLLEAIKTEQWVETRNIVTRNAATIRATVETVVNEGRVRVEHGVVYVDEMAMHTTLTTRMIKMSEAGFNIQPLINFLSNLATNPSYRAVHELYDFMEASNLPITDDGHFLAYKKIRSNYTDCHTGTFDNSVGATVQMQRYMVNEDKDDVCSAGLHFCSRNYLGHFGGDRIVVVKINPADVVSIPTDYQNSKGRCCKYVVVQELPNSDVDSTPLENMPAAVKRQETKEVIQRCDVADGEVLQTYDSVEDASSDTGLRVEYIERVLDGDRKSTGGFGWKRETINSIGYDLSNVSEYSEEEWMSEDVEGDDDDDDDNVGW